MHGILNPEGPVMSFITKITYSAYLNLLWLICCLPIVTAGASTTALFYVTLKVAKNEEGSLTKSFFHSFRENFRQATVIWMILLAVGIVLGIDGYIFYHMRFENAFWTVATAVFLIAAAAYAIILMYIFPLLARFDNTTDMLYQHFRTIHRKTVDLRKQFPEFLSVDISIDGTERAKRRQLLRNVH